MPSDEKVNVLTLRLGLIGLSRSADKKYKTEEIMALDRDIEDFKQKFHHLPSEEIRTSEPVRNEILRILARHGPILWPVPDPRNIGDRRWLPRAPTVWKPLELPTEFKPPRYGKPVEYKVDLVYESHREHIEKEFFYLLTKCLHYKRIQYLARKERSTPVLANIRANPAIKEVDTELSSRNRSNFLDFLMGGGKSSDAPAPGQHDMTVMMANHPYYTRANPSARGNTDASVSGVDDFPHARRRAQGDMTEDPDPSSAQASTSSSNQPGTSEEQCSVSGPSLAYSQKRSASTGSEPRPSEMPRSKKVRTSGSARDESVEDVISLPPRSDLPVAMQHGSGSGPRVIPSAIALGKRPTTTESETSSVTFPREGPFARLEHERTSGAAAGPMSPSSSTPSRRLQMLAIDADRPMIDPEPSPDIPVIPDLPRDVQIPSASLEQTPDEAVVAAEALPRNVPVSAAYTELSPHADLPSAPPVLNISSDDDTETGSDNENPGEGRRDSYRPAASQTPSHIELERRLANTWLTVKSSSSDGERLFKPVRHCRTAEDVRWDLMRYIRDMGPDFWADTE